MSKTNQKERYEDFLNEAIDLMKFGPINNLSDLARKHGVSQNLIPFIRETGLFIPESGSRRYPQWKTLRTSHYTPDEVTMVIADYHKWNGQKKPVAVETIQRDYHLDNGISKYTTKQLTDELKRRGYSGSMYIKKQLTF